MSNKQIDEQDRGDLVATALREAYEEIGLRAEELQVIGSNHNLIVSPFATTA